MTVVISKPHPAPPIPPMTETVRPARCDRGSTCAETPRSTNLVAQPELPERKVLWHLPAGSPNGCQARERGVVSKSRDTNLSACPLRHPYLSPRRCYKEHLNDQESIRPASIVSDGDRRMSQGAAGIYEVDRRLRSYHRTRRGVRSRCHRKVVWSDSANQGERLIGCYRGVRRQWNIPVDW